MKCATEFCSGYVRVGRLILIKTLDLEEVKIVEGGGVD